MQIYIMLAILIKKKRRKLLISEMRGIITADPMDIKIIIKEYY